MTKIQSKGHKSARSRVANISEFLEKPMTTKAFREKILNGLYAENPDFETYKLTEEDWKGVRQLKAEKYDNWDWRTGKFLENTDKTWNNKEVLKIPGFVSVLPSRTKIVYVVNMARPTPSTGVSVTSNEKTLKSTATLNLKIDDMISAINKFKDAGKMPYAVELGNEFYFGNEESGIFHIVENYLSQHYDLRFNEILLDRFISAFGGSPKRIKNNPAYSKKGRFRSYPN